MLVVDNDAAVREGSAALLAKWGCDPVVTATPTAAIAAPGSTDVALIDLDLGADGDGINLIRRLRARSPDIVCALVAADLSVVTVSRCAAESIALLAKPIDTALLAQWLEDAAPRVAAPQ